MNYKQKSLDPSLGVTLNFLRKIGFLLKTHVVNDIELTLDQWQHLHSIARMSVDIAEIWEALATSSPFPWDKQNDINYGNKTYREMLEKRVGELIQWRKLIDYASPDMIYCCHELLDSDIKNDIDLLNAGIWTDAINFFNTCLEPYNEISNGKIIKELDTLLKWVNNLSSNPQAPPPRIIKFPKTRQDFSNPYWGFVASYYEELINLGDKQALQLIKNSEAIFKENREYLLRKRRRKITPSSVNRNIFIPYRSHSWQNGKKISASPGGIYVDPDRR